MNEDTADTGEDKVMLGVTTNTGDEDSLEWVGIITTRESIVGMQHGNLQRIRRYSR
jgi:hypothetical protein